MMPCDKANAATVIDAAEADRPLEPRQIASERSFQSPEIFVQRPAFSALPPGTNYIFPGGQ